tara:strand:+ start:450 stop:581 length:132 start_codon:yes stop_codon:yes gene_type:complete
MKDYELEELFVNIDGYELLYWDYEEDAVIQFQNGFTTMYVTCM